MTRGLDKIKDDVNESGEIFRYDVYEANQQLPGKTKKAKKKEMENWLKTIDKEITDKKDKSGKKKSDKILDDLESYP